MYQESVVRCGRCQTEITSCYTHHIVQEDGTSMPMCSKCHLTDSARRMGIKPPSHFEFSPLTLFDSIGKKHTFHFDVMLTTGLGITAREILDDGSTGYQFAVLEHPETDIVELFDLLLKKMKAGLAERYLKSETFGGFNPLNSRIYIKGSAVNGIVSERENNETGAFEPSVVVDGKEMSWSELGAVLSSYTGFGFRIECFDLVDRDIDISSNPKEPDHCWWLEKNMKDSEPLEERYQ